MTPQQAALSAGYSPNCVDSLPYQILQYPEVAKFIDENQRLKTAVVVANDIQPNLDLALTKAEKRAFLADILRNGKPTVETNYSRKIEGRPGMTATMTRCDTIAAIQEDNKMMGHYAPSQHLIAQKVIFEIENVDRKKRGED